MAFTKTTFQLFSQHLGNADPGAYIGTAGEIFYDPNTGILKLSDGLSPGGIAITSGGAAAAFDPSLYYTKAAVDGKFTALLGTADAQSDTLGELQTKVDGKLSLAGGTLTGPVYYASLPVGINELTNKNYVDQKVSASITTALASLTTDVVTEGVLNKYFTQANFNQAFSTKSTTNLVEGTNLYWTQARFDSNFATSIADPVKTPGFVRTVNGVAPSEIGNVTLSLTATATGTLAARPNISSDGTLYVITGDSDANNDGRSFLWTNSTSQWVELAPSDTAANDARYVNIAGDTMAGALTLAADPLAPLQAATKQYVDAKTYSLNDLTDANTAGSVAGQALVYNGTEWKPATPASTVNDLSDANTVGATVGQALTYNGTEWVPATPAARLGDLIDVSNTAPTAGQVLGWDSTASEWKPLASSSAPTLATLLDVDVTGVANNSSIKYDETSTKWKIFNEQAKPATLLPNHGTGYGRAHVYGNQVFTAGFNGSERIHAWGNSGSVRVSQSAPFEVRPPGIKKLVDGMSYQHVLGTDGILYSRGRDSEGQLGTNASPGRPTVDSTSIFKQNRDPKIYGTGIEVLDVWSQRQHWWEGVGGGSLWVLVNDNGTKKLYAAGYNSNGVLGVGGATNTGSLIQESVGSQPQLSRLNGKGIKKVDCHSTTVLFVTENGELWGAGMNSNGPLGIDFIGDSALSQSKYADGSFVSGVVDAIIDYQWNVGVTAWFLRNDGTVWGSGSNGESQLCNGASGSTTKFKQVLIAANTPITGVVKIINPGRGQLFMLKSDGTVWATGRNHDSVFGNSAFATYTAIGNFAKQIQTGIEDMWTTGSNVAGYCLAFWKKDGKYYFSGYNGNYTGGSFTEQLGREYYNFLQPIEFFDDKVIVDIKLFNRVAENGDNYRCTAFLTDEGDIYVSGNSGHCHVPDDGDDIFLKQPFKLADYLGGETKSVVVTKVEADIPTTATTGQVLTFNGTKWVASSFTALASANSQEPVGSVNSSGFVFDGALGPSAAAQGTYAGDATYENTGWGSRGIRLINGPATNTSGSVSWGLPYFDFTKAWGLEFKGYFDGAGDQLIVSVGGYTMVYDSYNEIHYLYHQNNMASTSGSPSPALSSIGSAQSTTGTQRNKWTSVRLEAFGDTLSGKRYLMSRFLTPNGWSTALASDITGKAPLDSNIRFRAWVGGATTTAGFYIQNARLSYL